MYLLFLVLHACAIQIDKLIEAQCSHTSLKNDSVCHSIASQWNKLTCLFLYYYWLSSILLFSLLVCLATCHLCPWLSLPNLNILLATSVHHNQTNTTFRAYNLNICVHAANLTYTHTYILVIGCRCAGVGTHWLISNIYYRSFCLLPVDPPANTTTFENWSNALC